MSKLKENKKYILKITTTVIVLFIILTISILLFAIYKCPMINIANIKDFL